MKIAIISDIHSNPTELLKVLKDAEERKCERIVCLGDIVGYGYDPNTCIDIIRDRKIECIIGNHDAGLVGSLSLDWFNPFAKNAILRQRSLVTEDRKEWLSQLPYSVVEQEGFATPDEKKFKIAYVHGELKSPKEFNYINGYLDAALEFPFLVEEKVRVLFVGHTHFANVYLYNDDGRISENYFDPDDEEVISLDKERCAIINVGSCGYPRNQPYSIYGIYETTTHEFYHRILPFDFDNHIQRMRAADAEIPLWIQSQKTRAEERQIGLREWKRYTT